LKNKRAALPESAALFSFMKLTPVPEKSEGYKKFAGILKSRDNLPKYTNREIQ
jgi:hypothetical protein